MAFVYTKLLDRAQAGPLVADVSLDTFWDIIRDRRNVEQLVNAQFRQAEAGLPEGTRVEIVLACLYTVQNIRPSDLAYRFNLAYIEGKLVDPGTGEAMRAWPEHGNTVAWANDAAGTLTLRWRKGVVWGWRIIWYLVGVILFGLAAYYIYKMIHASGWTAFKVIEQREIPVNSKEECLRQGGTWDEAAKKCYKKVITPWGWLLFGLGALGLLAGAPWAARKVAAAARAKREAAEE
ncbi:MAG: hypothetical protein AB1374_05980 [Bacillota bacterium]